MRVIAILASHNEEVYVRACLENYASQGVETYLIDNESTDGTVDLARSYLGRGLIGIENFPRHGRYEWLPLLRRKEEVADQLLADWFIHADMDEIRRPPRGFATIATALAEIDKAGYTTTNFKNFLFMPVQESPDHFHPRFPDTLLFYRYMEPSYPNQVKAWKRQKSWTLSQRLRFHLGRKLLASKGAPSVNLTASGGHKVDFPGARLAPTDFVMRHYPVLSLDHAIRKYVEKTYATEEVGRGFHGWKSAVRSEDFRLPSRADTLTFAGDDELDVTNPITRTLIYSPEIDARPGSTS